LAQDQPVTLAAIIGAHGVTGEVRLKLFGDGVAALKQHRVFNVSGNDGTLTVEKLKDDGKGGAIARFAEVADRTAAEALRGTALTVPRASLPPLGEGEYYYADLIGLPAVGAGDVLEIELPPEGGKPGKRFMVPMTAEAVPEWMQSRIVIDAGWVE
jgi:16S rRNA processing protein RimM